MIQGKKTIWWNQFAQCYITKIDFGEYFMTMYPETETSVDGTSVFKGIQSSIKESQSGGIYLVVVKLFGVR